MQSWERLARINKHPRDERIEFEELTHTYTIDGSRIGWISCTRFLDTFFGHFDADKVIAKMMNSSNWTSSQYFGKSAHEIKAGWEEKKISASSAGTRMHLDIERFYNAIPLGWNNDLKPIDTASGLRMLEQDGWAPQEGAEWKYFCSYHDKYGSQFIPYRTEWVVFDEEHHIAGSIDMVYLKSDGTLAIYDWKRVEELKTENKWQSGLGPLEHLPDTNYWHYSLQLNVYRYILQKHYGFIVSELALVILHPSNRSWRVVKISFMDEEIKDMLHQRLTG